MSQYKMKQHTVTVLGDGGVGKTSICTRFAVEMYPETYDPTYDGSFRKQIIVDEQVCMIEILDTAGQEEYSAMRDLYIREGEAFLIVYSISSRNAFESVKKLYEDDVKRVKGKAAPFVPVMIVGNKSDLGPEDRVVSTDDGAALAKAMGGLGFIETSAKDGSNVEKAFSDLIKLTRQAKRKEDEQILQRERERQLQAEREERGESSLKGRWLRLIAKLKF